MNRVEIANLVIAIVAIIVSLFTLAWTLFSYFKDRKHEFYSTINDVLKEICFAKLPAALDLFIDTKAKRVDSDKYDGVSEILIYISKTIRPLKYFDLGSYNLIINHIVNFDEICIELSDKKIIENEDVTSFQNKIVELFDAIRKFYKKH